MSSEQVFLRALLESCTCTFAAQWLWRERKEDRLSLYFRFPSKILDLKILESHCPILIHFLVICFTSHQMPSCVSLCVCMRLKGISLLKIKTPTPSFSSELSEILQNISRQLILSVEKKGKKRLGSRKTIHTAVVNLVISSNTLLRIETTFNPVISTILS